MTSVLESFIPKFLVSLNKLNDDVTTLSTRNLSEDGDIYTIDRRVFTPSVVQTTQSLQELQPEISYTYPYKIVTPLDYDGSTIILSPSITTQPTASQGYYAPAYFERYNPDILRNLDKTFTELTVISPALEE